MATNAELIEQLENVVYGGVSSTSTDGESVSFDIEQARKALDELKKNDPQSIAEGRSKPRMTRARFGGIY